MNKLFLLLLLVIANIAYADPSDNDDYVANLDKREMLTSMSSGTVTVHCEVLMKGFRDQHISGDR